jgi:hypothetical protein
MTVTLQYAARAKFGPNAFNLFDFNSLDGRQFNPDLGYLF